jgi:hypothetical protein
MPGAINPPDRPIEYVLLRHVTPAGPTMGYLGDHAIRARVIDEHGRRFAYAGVAPRRWNGSLDRDALTPGEFILPPGLVYRIERAPASRWAALFG